MSPIGHGGVTGRDRVVSPTGHGGIIQGHRDVTRRDVEVSALRAQISPVGTEVSPTNTTCGAWRSPIGCGDVTWMQRCYVTHRDRGGVTRGVGKCQPWGRRLAQRCHTWGTEASPVGRGGVTSGHRDVTQQDMARRCHPWHQTHTWGHGDAHVGDVGHPWRNVSPVGHRYVTHGLSAAPLWAPGSTLSTGVGWGGNWAHWEALRGSSAGGCGWWGGDHGVIVGMWHWEHWECGRQNGVALRALSGTGMQQGGTGSTG